jgi:outer membrane protein assembly factor BamB
MKNITCCVALIITFTIAQVGMAQEWPQFRGPEGSGKVDAALPVSWSETEHVTWKTELPGRGWSSPVISGDFIWMTTGIEKQATPEELAKRVEGRQDAKMLALAKEVTLQALCVSRESGSLLHQVSLFDLKNPEPIHALNSFASPTPVIAGERVFCHFGSDGTACLDLKSGEVIWKNDSIKYDSQNGAGSSPVAWKNLLIFHCDGRDKQFVVALDQASGEVVWQVDRSGKLPDNDDFKKAYGTPLIVNENGKAQLISPASDWVYSYDPETGKELWRAPYGELGFSVVPKPVAANGRVYVLTSFMKSRLLALDYNGEFDNPEKRIAWTVNTGMPSKPSLIVHEDRLYAIDDKGIATCVNVADGEVLWRERIGGNFSASPLMANGLLYLFDQDGKATVGRVADDKFEKIKENSLDGSFMASAAVVDNTLFLRTDKALYRIED